MMFARYVSLAAGLRLLALYALLVFYSAAYEFFYANQLTTLINDDFTAFDHSKLEVYRIICFLTPLAILPIGTRLRSPGQFIAGASAVILFIPIPIVFVAMVSVTEFWHVYALLWLGAFAVSSLSSLSVRLPQPQITERGFKHIMFMLYAALGIGLIYTIASNQFHIVNLASAHAARESVTVSGIGGYVLVGFISSFGGLLIAIAVMFRKFYLVPLAFLGFVCCYGALAERDAVFMPAWIVYMWIAQRVFFRGSVTRYLLTAMAPFLTGVVLGAALGLEDQTSVLYDAFTLANYRLYSIPAIGFNIYYNFFALNPVTHWSHIGVVSNFVHYPYGEPLALVLAEAYKLGNENASFLQTDGLAAAGTVSLPFVSLVFGVVLVAVNSCMRGLNLTMLAIVSAGPSIALIDTGLGPGLLTNGLALLSAVLLYAPRSAAWNLRYRGGQQVAAVPGHG